MSHKIISTAHWVGRAGIQRVLKLLSPFWITLEETDDCQTSFVHKRNVDILHKLYMHRIYDFACLLKKYKIIFSRVWPHAQRKRSKVLRREQQRLSSNRRASSSYSSSFYRWYAYCIFIFGVILVFIFFLYSFCDTQLSKIAFWFNL